MKIYYKIDVHLSLSHLNIANIEKQQLLAQHYKCTDSNKSNRMTLCACMHH